ncbi:MAG: hypothetical protein Q9194_003063, partial [Teloschistes cf. exilis]
ETYRQRFAAKMEQKPLNEDVEPAMTAAGAVAGAKGDEILFLIDIIHLCFVQLASVRF